MFLSYVGMGLMAILALRVIAFDDLHFDLYNENVYIFAAISAAIVYIMYIISVPFIYGTIWYSQNAVKYRVVPAHTLFGCYNDPEKIKKALLLEGYLTLRKLPVLLPLTAASVVDIMLTLSVVRITDGLMPFFAAFGCLLSVFGMFMLYKVYALRFFPVRHIFVENPDIKPTYIVNRALFLTKGKVNLIAGVYVTLLPLYLLSLAILPALVVMPVASSVYSYLYNEIKSQFFA
jgi:hypothetical protein